MTTKTRPTFGQTLAAISAELSMPAPAPQTVRQVLRAKPARYTRPTACVVCGGPLPKYHPAHCSYECANAALGR